MVDETEREDEGSQPEQAPEPHDVFARARDEGARRLRRSRLELTTTSLDVVANFAIAAAGNMLGGLVFVTLTRTSQAIGSGNTNAPTQ